MAKRAVGYFESFSRFLPGAARENSKLEFFIDPASEVKQALNMAPIEKKRHHDLTSFRTKKRQRVNPKNGDSGERLKDRPVGLDELPWNQVAVDRLEDAEGFFGLEELSDVDVVKNPTLGKVEYKVCKQTARGPCFGIY